MPAKQKKDLFSTSQQQAMFSYFPKKQGHSTRSVASKALIINAPYAFLLAFIAEHDIIRYRISLWSVWVSCPSCVPSNLSPTPSLLAFGEEGWKDGLDAVSALLCSSQNTGVLSTHFQPQIQSTALWGLLWGKLTPSQPDSIYNCILKLMNYVFQYLLKHWMILHHSAYLMKYCSVPSQMPWRCLAILNRFLSQICNLIKK